MSNYKQSTWWSIFLLFIYASIVNRYFNFTEEIIWLLINKNKGKNTWFSNPSWYTCIMKNNSNFWFFLPRSRMKIVVTIKTLFKKSVANWKCLEQVSTLVTVFLLQTTKTIGSLILTSTHILFATNYAYSTYRNV